MFRLSHTRHLNRNLQQLTSNRRLSITSISAKKIDNENKDDEIKNKKTIKPDINSLISSMEVTTNNNNKSSRNMLQNLMEVEKSKEGRFPQKAQMDKKVQEISKLKSKQGREFLFKKVEKKYGIKKSTAIVPDVIREKDIVETETFHVTSTQKSKIINDTENAEYEIHVDEIIDGGEYVDGLIPQDSSPSQGVNVFQLEQLKEDIKVQGDNRDVTKLMSALIEEIDEELPNPDEKLKNLMDAMNINIKSQPKSYKEGNVSTQSSDRQYKRPRRQRDWVDFNKGPSTNLFSGYSMKSSEHSKHNMSLHEQTWLKELNDMLPENIPQNLFEVMMLDIDKQWKFPIDNEQDMGIEDETSFEEHVFLDHFLDEFPDKEPIQKFMELVITGLQQNPYLSVEEKKNRILWYKGYFEKFPDEDLSFA